MIIYLPLLRERKVAEIKQLYKNAVGKELNLESPKTFNEKIQWLKLNHVDPRAKRDADKLTARDMVAEIAGSKYLIPLIGVYDRVDEIDWSKLPNKFVIKISDGYNQHLVCTDKSVFDVDRAKDLLAQWLKPTSRIYWRKGSYPGQYKNSHPMIMIEEYIGDKNEQINEYKFMYLSGKLAFIFAPTDRDTNNTNQVDLSYFDKNWQPISIQKHGHKRSPKEPPKPKTLNEMLKMSRKLAKGFPVCRVDLYEVEGKVKFGELTFTPDDGRAIYSPDTLDLELGKLIKLPKRNNYNILEWRPTEVRPRAWIGAVKEKSNRMTKRLNIKEIIKAVLPYGVLAMYRRGRNNTQIKEPQAEANSKGVDIRFLGHLSNQEIIDVMGKEGAYIHFGQSAEDAIINRVFLGKKNGFYVDVGAFHPTLYSNTYLLNKFLNWRGINIDASKEAIDAFKVSRPNDTNLNVAIGKDEKIQEFTVYSTPARNTFSDNNRQRQEKKNDTEIVRTENVKVKPLKKVLDEYVPKGTKIDVLDIDIEGYDLQALETNDWKKYRPTVILIEDYQINTVGFGKSKVYKFMQKHDYRFFSHNFDTSIYVDSEMELGL